jgi:hypothetical protein
MPFRESAQVIQLIGLTSPEHQQERGENVAQKGKPSRQTHRDYMPTLRAWQRNLVDRYASRVGFRESDRSYDSKLVDRSEIGSESEKEKGKLNSRGESYMHLD